MTIYQFTKYDITTDENRKSRRWATREAIEWLGGSPLEDTAIEVDASMVGGEIAGMTQRGFNPSPMADVQRIVRPFS
jgi:hypothetical protein